MIYLFWIDGPVIGPLSCPVENLELHFTNKSDATDWFSILGGEQLDNQLKISEALLIGNAEFRIAESRCEDLSPQDAHDLNIEFFGSQLDYIAKLTPEKYSALSKILETPDPLAPVLHTV